MIASAENMKDTKTEMQERYFKYMMGIVGIKDGMIKDRCYSMLFHHLHRIIFTPFVGLDINRAHDGKGLRYDFIYYSNQKIVEFNGKEISRREKWSYSEEDMVNIEGPCSILEMIIALCNRRWDYRQDAYSAPYDMFVDILHNLKLTRYDDGHYNHDRVAFIIDRVNQREFDEDGKGGMFPIPDFVMDGVWFKDQREIDIWFQVDKYLAEKFGKKQLKYSNNGRK